MLVEVRLLNIFLARLVTCSLYHAFLKEGLITKRVLLSWPVLQGPIESFLKVPTSGSLFSKKFMQRGGSETGLLR